MVCHGDTEALNYSLDYVNSISSTSEQSAHSPMIIQFLNSTSILNKDIVENGNVQGYRIEAWEVYELQSVNHYGPFTDKVIWLLVAILAIHSVCVTINLWIIKGCRLWLFCHFSNIDYKIPHLLKYLKQFVRKKLHVPFFWANDKIIGRK